MGALACKAKIIMDGGNAARSALSLVDTTASLTEDQVGMLDDRVAYPIIDQIITAERALEKAQSLLLDAIGYDGPRP